MQVETELVHTTNQPLARVEVQPGAADDVTRLLQLAVEKDLSVEKMEKLVALYERMADRRAAAEFAEAMARFQETCPPVERTSKASIVTKSGAKFGYTYAELDEIARTVAPHLHAQGLSYSWDCTIAGNQLTCTCTLRHANGHSVKASFQGSTTTDAGMTEIQKNAAALTFARRQSLIQVLGLTTCDEDQDGEDRHGMAERITEAQVETLNNLIIDTGSDRKRFLAWAGVEKLADLPGIRFNAAVEALEKKRKAGP